MSHVVSFLTEEDPLAPAGARFALSVKSAELPFSDEPPSDPSTRPFVLRVAAAPAPRRPNPLPPSRYCPDRQIAVTADAPAVPLYRLGYEVTTIASKDGSSDPMEDWKPDLPNP